MAKKQSKGLLLPARILWTFRIIPALFAALTIALLLPAKAEDGKLRIPFKKTGQGAIDGWKIKEWAGKADFNVIDSEFGPAIRLKSSRTSSALYKDINLDIKQLPRLSWRWRVTELPKNGDVRKRDADDQAAQVYVVFPKWPTSINSRVIGYIWDASAPAGQSFTSQKSRNTKYVVMRSGASGLGQWFQETRNVYEDYKRLFKEEPQQAGSVSIMIDSDDTASSAESYIADIYFSK